MVGLVGCSFAAALVDLDAARGFEESEATSARHSRFRCCSGGLLFYGLPAASYHALFDGEWVVETGRSVSQVSDAPRHDAVVVLLGARFGRFERERRSPRLPHLALRELHCKWVSRVLEDALDDVGARVLDELPHSADAVLDEGVFLADADDLEGSRLGALHFVCSERWGGEEGGRAVSDVRQQVAPVDCDQYLLFEAVELQLLEEVWHRTDPLSDPLPML